MSDSVYTIEVSSDAKAYLQTLPGTVLDKAIHSIDLLATTPFLGREYNPEYESATAPVPCRMLTVPRTTAQLFYVIDDKGKRVVIVWAGDARMNPVNRFQSRE